MKSEAHPYRCPVWDCRDGYPRFRTKQELKTHLELSHTRSVKKNGIEKLIKEAKEMW